MYWEMSIWTLGENDFLSFSIYKNGFEVHFEAGKL
jgi:hypothetical protein